MRPTWTSREWFRQNVSMYTYLTSLVGLPSSCLLFEGFHELLRKFFFLESQLPFDIPERSFDRHIMYTMRRSVEVDFHESQGDSILGALIAFVSEDKAVSALDQNNFFFCVIGFSKARAREIDTTTGDCGLSFEIGSVWTTESGNVGSSLAVISLKTKTRENKKRDDLAHYQSSGNLITTNPKYIPSKDQILQTKEAGSKTTTHWRSSSWRLAIGWRVRSPSCKADWSSVLFRHVSSIFLN